MAASIYMLMTGARPAQTFRPTRACSVAAPSRAGTLAIGGGNRARSINLSSRGQFGFVSVCGPILEGGVTGVGQVGPGSSAALAYDSVFRCTQDPAGKPVNVETAHSTGPTVTPGPDEKPAYDICGPAPAHACRRLRQRTTTRPLVAARLREDIAGQFKLDDEDPRLRDPLWPNRAWGQSCLLARRLVEAGTHASCK